MTINTQTIVDTFKSHLLTLGVFESVNGHEPKNSPGNGLTAAIWVRSMRPTTAFTALAKTSAVITFTIRIYSNMLAEPQDAIDPNLMSATDSVFSLISGDFTLGDAVDFVDLLGQTGQLLEAESGYVDLSGTMYRVIDITVPVVIGDAWDQAR